MNMQERIFMAIVSKLGFSRFYGLSHFVSDKDRYRAVRSPSVWFQSIGRGSRRRPSTDAQSHGHQEIESLEDASFEGEDNRWRVVSSDVQWDGMLRIGVLDDSSIILGLIETVLTMDGHKVFKHDSGSSLLNALFPEKSEEQSQYDLVILDLLLPGAQSGVDVFFAIRQQFTADILPIIVITAVDEPTLKQFRHILPDDVPLLRKPFDPRKLRQLIAELTGQKVNKY